MSDTILSLFDYSGNWSRPYGEAGYDVIQVDIKLGQDIMTFDYRNLPRIHGVLAAPPCTDFASSGNRWWTQKDRDGRTAHSVLLVAKTLEIIEYLRPAWWVLENPAGRIRSFFPKLERAWFFQPCDFGDPYTKKTGLYGNFIAPMPLFVGHRAVAPTEGSKMHRLPPSANRAELRSMTPPGFAAAFFKANP